MGKRVSLKKIYDTGYRKGSSLAMKGHGWNREGMENFI
jgi:hypothetical protein